MLREHEAWLADLTAKVPLNPWDTRRANLCQADLQESDLNGTDLRYASLHGANLQRALLGKAQLQKAYLYGAKLQGAFLLGANLQGAELHEADLQGAFLFATNLRDAELLQANLQHVDLRGAFLDGVSLLGVDLSGAIFEPYSLPTLIFIDSAINLDGMRFLDSPTALVELREAFKKAGMRAQERQITYAIEHTRTEKAWHPAWPDLSKKDERPWLEQLWGKLEWPVKLLAFELTNDYGMSYGRPLKILAVSIGVFALVYLFAL